MEKESEFRIGKCKKITGEQNVTTMKKKIVGSSCCHHRRRRVVSRIQITLPLLLMIIVLSQSHVHGFPGADVRRIQSSPVGSSLSSTRRRQHLFLPQQKPMKTRTRTSSSSSTSTTALQINFNVDDFIFQAQSAASSVAQLSLGSADPSSNLLKSIPLLYGAGLLTSVSPCVWGLLPLTMSYISNAAGERSDQATTLPTLAFAAGLASVFCALGLAAAAGGAVVFGSSTTIWLPLLSNLVCCLMGLQLLELINVPLLSSSPSIGSNTNNFLGLATSKTEQEEPILIDGTGQILPSSSSKTSKKQDEQGSLVRTFLLGGSSALVASPCATPVLTSILAYVANEESSHPIVGAAFLLVYTLGYSTPLLITAATGGQFLVKLKELGSTNETSFYGQVAPWISPITAGILLWYGVNGLLVTLFGDPSLAGLAPILE